MTAIQPQIDFRLHGAVAAVRQVPDAERLLAGA
jgi:hypothetical protein